MQNGLSQKDEDCHSMQMRISRSWNRITNEEISESWNSKFLQI